MRNFPEKKIHEPLLYPQTQIPCAVLSRAQYLRIVENSAAAGEQSARPISSAIRDSELAMRPAAHSAERLLLRPGTPAAAIPSLLPASRPAVSSPRAAPRAAAPTRKRDGSKAERLRWSNPLRRDAPVVRSTNLRRLPMVRQAGRARRSAWSRISCSLPNASRQKPSIA